MSDPVIVILVIATLAVVLALLIGTIASSLHWVLKAFLILASVVLTAGSSYAYREARGYAVVAPPPPRFRLLWALVHEPVPGRNDEGWIQIWIVQPDDAEPRVIKIPYTREDHQKVEKAKSQISKGESVTMGGDKGANARGQGGQDGKGGKGTGYAVKSPQGSGGGPSARAGTGGQSPVNAAGLLDFVAPPSTMPRKD